MPATLAWPSATRLTRRSGRTQPAGWPIAPRRRNPDGTASGECSLDLLDDQFTDLLLYPIKLANQAADVFFYDVGNLEPCEWERLSPLADLKGTIIVVSPRA